MQTRNLQWVTKGNQRLSAPSYLLQIISRKSLKTPLTLHSLKDGMWGQGNLRPGGGEGRSAHFLYPTSAQTEVGKLFFFPDSHISFPSAHLPAVSSLGKVYLGRCGEQALPKDRRHGMCWRHLCLPYLLPLC